MIHSGIYYKPGSLKAVNCREGRLAVIKFCQEEGVAHDICGKVIVALEESELPPLQRIFERGQANGVKCEVIGPERLHELEPHSAGIRAIHVPAAGIVDYRGVSQRLAAHIERAGGSIVTKARVTAIHHESTGNVVLHTSGEVAAKYVVNCAGLYCDRVTEMSGVKPEAKVVPFRGEYYELIPAAEHLCRNLIYPVPDPAFPFLGVHFTRMALGGVECGPNAVLAFAREGYHLGDVNVRDLVESLTYPGFLRMAARNWKRGSASCGVPSARRPSSARCNGWCPKFARAPAPIPRRRAGAGPPRDGSLVDDFAIQVHDHVVNVLNAPSPAATASLNIGRLIVDRLAQQF